MNGTIAIENGGAHITLQRPDDFLRPSSEIQQDKSYDGCEIRLHPAERSLIGIVFFCFRDLYPEHTMYIVGSWAWKTVAGVVISPTSDIDILVPKVSNSDLKIFFGLLRERLIRTEYQVTIERCTYPEKVVVKVYQGQRHILDIFTSSGSDDVTSLQALLDSPVAFRIESGGENDLKYCLVSAYKNGINAVRDHQNLVLPEPHFTGDVGDIARALKFIADCIIAERTPPLLLRFLIEGAMFELRRIDPEFDITRLSLRIDELLDRGFKAADEKKNGDLYFVYLVGSGALHFISQIAYPCVAQYLFSPKESLGISIFDFLNLYGFTYSKLNEALRLFIDDDIYDNLAGMIITNIEYYLRDDKTVTKKQITSFRSLIMNFIKDGEIGWGSETDRYNKFARIIGKLEEAGYTILEDLSILRKFRLSPVSFENNILVGVLVFGSFCRLSNLFQDDSTGYIRYADLTSGNVPMEWRDSDDLSRRARYNMHYAFAPYIEASILADRIVTHIRNPKSSAFPDELIAVSLEEINAAIRFRILTGIFPIWFAIVSSYEITKFANNMTVEPKERIRFYVKDHLDDLLRIEEINNMEYLKCLEKLNSILREGYQPAFN